MDCRAALDLIMRYLDGEATKDEERLLYKHLDMCEECSFELQALKDTYLLLGEIELEEPPEGFEEAILSSIKKENSLRIWSKAGIIGAVFSLVVLVLWFGLTHILIYTPAVYALINYFNDAISLIGDCIAGLGKLFYTGLTIIAKLLTLGRAFGVLEKAVIETYSIIIIAMAVLLCVILKLYDYMFNN